MSNPKTNNSYLVEKVALRCRHLPIGDNIKVLDLFHGNGIIWESVKVTTKRKITVHGFDIKEYDRISLIGENEKSLPSVDVNKYDVIDVDDYGIPYNLVKEILSRKITRDIVVFYTFIQTGMGQLNKNLLLEVGFTEAMYKASPIMCSRGGHEKWLLFLANNGIDHVDYITHSRKNYGCFVVHPRG
jgi:hypothetical protein